MLRISHFKPVEQLVQGRLKLLVVLPHLCRSDHLHDHREVLFIGWGLIVEIEHQRQEQHLRRLIPKGVLGLAALWRGVLKQVRHQTLNVIVTAQVDKGVVTMAFLHVDEVDHLNVIAFGFEEISGIPEQFPLGVEAYQAGIGVHDIHFRKETGFARAAAAAAKNIQIAAVFSAVQTDGHILREYLVGRLFPVCVLLIDHARNAPFGRAVFLPSPVVAVGGQIDADAQTIAQKKKEDSFYTVLAERDMKWSIERRAAVSEQTHKAISEVRRKQQRKPDHGNNAAGIEDQTGTGKLILFHGRLSVFPFLLGRR